MEDPPLLLNDANPNLQIQQDVKGDRNQTIGQVLGGMVVYGTVIYNNPPASADAATNQDIKIGANPYKGLLAFQETDGDRFFGRDLQIKELWDKFRSLHEDESQTRLLTIYGPSGSGKSSLARAGLIPELARRPLPGRERARVAVLVPGSHPLESLATVLARIATNDSSPVAKIREFATELAQVNAEGIYDGLRRIADALPEIEIAPLIILVDQLEEVFTLCKDSVERNAFIGNLLCAATDRSKRVAVILTLRSDFLGATQQHPQLNQSIGLQGFFVAAMSEEGLRQAISKPAELAGHPLDLSTIDLLIEQTAGREGALPLLQFALVRIWAGLIEGKDPAETLRSIGGVGGALAGEAQRIYGGLTPAEQGIARRVFLGLVQLGEGAKDTRRRTELDRVVSHHDSLEQVEKVIARFADPGVRLITLANEGGEETAEVTHEALFDNWQQLKDWLDGSRSDLRFQRRLDDAVMVWQDNGRPEGNLWRSPDLDLLRRYQERAGDDMTPLQIQFLEASVDANDKTEIEREKTLKEREANAREREVVALKIRQQKNILLVVLSAGLMLSSTAGIIAYQNSEQNRISREQIHDEQLLQDRILQFAQNRDSPRPPYTIDILARRYEGEISTHLGTDFMGGVYYGIYRIKAGPEMDAYLAFLSRWAPEYYDKLIKAGGGVSALRQEKQFIETWRTLGNDPSSSINFSRLQTDFTTQTSYKILVARLNSPHAEKPCQGSLPMSIDVEKRTIALQAVIFSIAIQYGPNTCLVQEALRDLDDISKRSDEEIITQLYKFRDKLEVYFPDIQSRSNNFARLIRERNHWEQKDANYILKEENGMHRSSLDIHD